MFKVRSEQIEQMRLGQEAEYNRRLARYFRSNSPRVVERLDDEELERRVARAVRSARGYGTKSDAGILKYVALSLAAGPSFDEDRKVQGFLSTPGHSMDSKIHWLMERVTNNLRAQGR